MLIMLEGVDGSGKTTLKNKLREEFNEYAKKHYKYAKCIDFAEELIPTKVDDKRVTFEYLQKALITMQESNDLYIMDRGPISDIIYRVFDDEQPIANLTNIRKLLPEGMLLIYCVTDKAYDNMKKRGDDNIIAKKNHKAISNLYEMIMGVISRFNHISTSLYDCYNKNNDILISNMIEYYCENLD